MGPVCLLAAQRRSQVSVLLAGTLRIFSITPGGWFLLLPKVHRAPCLITLTPAQVPAPTLNLKIFPLSRRDRSSSILKTNKRSKALSCAAKSGSHSSWAALLCQDGGASWTQGESQTPQGSMAELSEISQVLGFGPCSEKIVQAQG